MISVDRAVNVIAAATRFVTVPALTRMERVVMVVAVTVVRSVFAPVEVEFDDEDGKCCLAR